MIINKLYTDSRHGLQEGGGKERKKTTGEREKSAGIAITSFRLPLQEEADL